MRAAKAQRLRFGVLAARHAWERERLTPWQDDYLEGCTAVGWRVRDAAEAYRRETIHAKARAMVRRVYGL